jgi:hypothetical protein
MSDKQKPDDLDVEEAAVRAALRRRFTELKEVAARAADPRPFIEERPWTSCASAAAVGFGVGWMLGAPHPHKPEPPADGHDHHDHDPARHRSIMAMLAASVFPALQPMIKELVDTTLGTFGMPGHGKPPDLRQAADVPVPETMSPGMTADNQVV